VEVKRAFRKYLGPDDPGPFSDIINSMSFGCRHMKEYNRNGVFCLTGNIPEGRVKLMRVGDIDYIWTYGGGTGALYIILIPDLLRGFVIPVTLSKGDYAFGDFAVLEGGNIIRYEFDKDFAGITGSIPRQQYMPYIFKMLGTSHVSVGDPGSGMYPDPVNDWHNKFYVLDCTGDQSGSEVLWRPPSQVATVGFGEDLLPVWYAMSPITAHNFHWCYEAAIDQSKRIYQPVNTDVLLANDEVATPAGFTLVQRSHNRYNFLYPLQASRFYGKNAFDVVATEAGNVITLFGESIYVSGVVTASVPEGIDTILFFWPWIPYLDEIRSFNILSYGGRPLPFGGFDGFYMTPILDTFKKYGIGYYTNLGVYQTQELFEDIANFSDVTKSNVNTSSGGAIGCNCGDCATGSWLENKVTNVPPYNSSGTKYIPIGLIGGRIPISMKTTWQQSGSGPASTEINTDNITGNYPWGSLHSGSLYGLDHWYEACCIAIFHNDHNRVRTYTETASNHLTMQQVLKVGDDVIFEGDSSMDYDMEYNYQDSYNGSVNGTVAPPGEELPVCAGSINYTTQQMSVNQTQNLSWTDNTNYPSYAPCEGAWKGFDFSWSLSGGGSISSTTEQNITYTAPSANEGCINNATISLLCNGVAVDTLEISINAVTSLYTAYIVKTCTEKHCIDLGDEGCSGAIGGCAKCAEVIGRAYNCDGTVRSTPTCTTGALRTYATNKHCADILGTDYAPAGVFEGVYGKDTYYGLYADSAAAAVAKDEFCATHTCGTVSAVLNTYYGAKAIVQYWPAYYNTWRAFFWYPAEAGCNDSASNAMASCESADAAYCGALPSGFGTFDMRTEAQIAAGCCPAALL
jgi:hypothetical protein